MFSTPFYPAAFQYSPSFGSGFHYPQPPPPPPPPPPRFEQFCACPGHFPPHGFGGPFPPPFGSGFTYGLPVPPPPPFHACSPLGLHQLPFPPPFFHGTFIPHHPSPPHPHPHHPHPHHPHPHPHHGPGPHHGPHFPHPSPPPPDFSMHDEAIDIPGDQQEDDGAVRSDMPPPTPLAHECHDEPSSGLHGGLMGECNDHGKPRERELHPTPPPPPPPRHGPNPGDVPIPGGPPHPHGSRGRHRRHRGPFPRPNHGPPCPGGPPPPPDHSRFPPAPPPGHDFPGPCQHPGCFSTWPTWPPSPHHGPFHPPPQFAFTGCTCYEGPDQSVFNTSPFGQSCSCQLWDHSDQYPSGPPHSLSGHHRRGHRRGAFRGRGHRGPAQGHRWEWRAPPEPESGSESASDSTIEDREEDQAETELPNEVPRGHETTDQVGGTTGREDDWEGVEDDERVSPTILARSVEEGKAIED